MFRSHRRVPSPLPLRRRRHQQRRSGAVACHYRGAELLEPRLVLSAAFDLIGLTALRGDPTFAGLDGSGVGVAVIDTGIRPDHVAVDVNLVAWHDAIQPTNTVPFDSTGHGTHVAAAAAGANPEIGVATGADLIAVRSLAAPGESIPRFTDPISDGLLWVLQNRQQFNIRVVNLSLGLPGTNYNSESQVPFEEDAALLRQRDLIDSLEEVGVTVVVASGNYYHAPEYPSPFIQPGASEPAIFSTISVASTWPDDGAESSVFDAGAVYSYTPGSTHVAVDRDAEVDQFFVTSQRSTAPNQLVAPGVELLSASHESTTGLVRQTGTSMATALVSGVVALMQQAAQQFAGRWLMPDEVLDMLRVSADVIFDDTVVNNGRIPVVSDGGLFLPIGPEESVPETNNSYLRINAHAALQEVRQRLFVAAGNDGTDTNSQRSRATSAGVLLGEEGYLFTTDGQVLDQRILIEGEIGRDGQVAIGANDVDLYRIIARAPADLRVTTFPTPGKTEFDSLLRIFDSEGNELRADDNSNSSHGNGLYSDIVLPQIQPGTYYIGISSSGNRLYDTTTGEGATGGQTTGFYDLVIEFSNPDPNGVLTGAVPFEGLPSYFLGTIGSDRGIQVGSQDVDFFSVVAPDNGVLIIDVDTIPGGSFEVDSFVRVFRSATPGSILPIVQVASNDNDPAWQPGSFGRAQDSYLELAVNAGERLYVAVSDTANRDFNPLDPYERTAAGQGGFYDLYLFFDNGDRDGTIFTASEGSHIAIGATIENHVGIDFGAVVGQNGSKDVDYYKFTPTITGLLNVTITSPDQSLQPYMSMWEYDEQTITAFEMANTRDLSSSQLIVRVEAGRDYFVAVSGQGNEDFDWFGTGTGSGGSTGNYRLQSSILSLANIRVYSNETISDPTPYVVDSGPVVDWIGQDGVFAIGPSDVDMYSFEAPGTGRVEIVLRNTGGGFRSSLDPTLRVFNASGQELRINRDAHANTRDARIVLDVVAGERYWVGVSGTDNYDPQSINDRPWGGVGTYQFSIATLDPGEGAESLSTFALFEPAGSWFFLKDSNTPGPADNLIQFGPAGAGWFPLAGDWNGDGQDTLAVFDAQRSLFFFKNTNAPGPADGIVQFGPVGAGWFPIVGDWNGDGIDTFALFEPNNSLFFFKNTNAAGPADGIIQFGPAGAGWIPLAGDWDGNNIDTFALYEPFGSTFFFKHVNGPGAADRVIQFGPTNAGWYPLAGDWDATGTDTFALFAPNTSTFFFKNFVLPGPADGVIQFGPAGAGWFPLVGDWDGSSSTTTQAASASSQIVTDALAFSATTARWSTPAEPFSLADARLLVPAQVQQPKRTSFASAPVEPSLRPRSASSFSSEALDDAHEHRDAALEQLAVVDLSIDRLARDLLLEVEPRDLR